MSVADLTTVGTVELLTRAADAAGTAAELATGGPWKLDMIQPDMSGRHEYYLRGPKALGPQRHVLSARIRGADAALVAASGPDHWRAVDGLLRAMLMLHPGRESTLIIGESYCIGCKYEQFHPCPTLQALRPLAEQVLQHLGDTA